MHGRRWSIAAVFRIACFLVSPLLVFCLAPSPARGVMIPLSTDMLVQKADAAIIGDVVDVFSFWTPLPRQIRTKVKITVDAVLFGQVPEREIEVEVLGGAVGDTELVVSDAPSFKKGERMLVYLQFNRISVDGSGPSFLPSYKVLGLAQGKYTIGNNGLASRRGFSLLRKNHTADNDLPLDLLLRDIHHAAIGCGKIESTD